VKVLYIITSESTVINVQEMIFQIALTQNMVKVKEQVVMVG
jgi:hypothetical protein